MDEETKLLAGMGKFRIKAKDKIPIKEGAGDTHILHV